MTTHRPPLCISTRLQKQTMITVEISTGRWLSNLINFGHLPCKNSGSTSSEHFYSISLENWENQYAMDDANQCPAKHRVIVFPFITVFQFPVFCRDRAAAAAYS